MTNNDLDKTKLQLKVQALSERIAAMTTENENKVADLRVDLTLLSQRNQELEEQVRQHEERGQAFETLEGEVVND